LGTLGDGADAHVLLQPARLSRLLGTRLQRTTAEALAWPEGWAALDLRSKPDALLLSGLLMPAVRNTTLSAIDDQGIGHNGVLRVLPANTQLLSVQNISDAKRWLADQATVAQGDSLHAEALFHWVQGSMAFATTVGDTATTDYVVLQAGDPGAAEKALFTLCGAAACDSVVYRTVRINTLPLQDPFGLLLGPPFDAITSPQWCLLGDKVVMAKDRRALERSIDAWTDGTSLAADIHASEFFESITAESGRTYWCNVGATSAWMEQHLNTEGSTQWNGYESTVAQLSGFSLQLSPGQHGFHHINIRLQHGGALASAPSTDVAGKALWRITLRAPLARDPDLVLDHSTGTRYVLAQDTDHGMTAVSSTGKVMWTRELDGPILGSVKQVDRFKNGKLQLLFNTAQRVYMIDRNGKDVEGWPMTLKEKASGPLAVLDYDGKKDYRILVPTEEAGVVNLMPDGKPVTGWSVSRMTAVSDGPVRHLRVKNNDFLFVADHDGNVHLLDRKGAPRHAARLKLPRGATVLDVRMGISIGSCAIIWTDSSGAVKSGTIDGEVKELGRAAIGSVAYGDVDADGTGGILRTNGDSLVSEGPSAPSWARSFGCTLDGAARIIPIAKSRNGIAVSCANDERCWIMDGSGAVLPGMPLSGGRYFAVGDINKDGTVEMVSGSANGALSAVSLTNAAP
ncbi:MAG: PQQ-binding-like beta-propeller repeat protein, partial [Flavobacteriales bacterium]